jgi:hypothetical protein
MMEVFIDEILLGYGDFINGGYIFIGFVTVATENG